jgi:GT2 family glycosyltransferase
MIGIVTVNWKGYEITSQLAAQMLESDVQDFRLVIVNNSPEDVEKFSHCAPCGDARIQLIHSPTNVGYAGGLNLGIRALLPLPEISHFLLINNDVQIEKNFLARLLAEGQDPQKIYAPLLLYHDTGLVQNTGGNLYVWLGGALNMNKNVPRNKIAKKQPGFLSGCALFMHRQVIERVGLFDEAFGSYCEDVDYCIRSTAQNIGIEVLWEVSARHYQSFSTRGNPGYKVYLLNRNQILLARKHLPPLQRIIFICAAIARGAVQSLLSRQFRAYLRGVKEGLF